MPLNGGPAATRSATTAARTIDFLTLAQNLKLSKRTGWIKRDIKSPESIADHMYRVSLLALVAHEAGIDSSRCISLAVAHDLAEAIVGDIAPGDGISKAEKNKLESSAMVKIRRMLGQDSAAGIGVQELWEEYEAASTPEARLVKDFDKVEMIMQALEYEQAQGADLQEFFDSTAGKFKTETGQALANEITTRRRDLLNGGSRTES